MSENGKNDPAKSNPEKSGTNALDLSAGAITALLHSGSGVDIRSAFTRDIYLVHQMIVGMRYQGGADDLIRDLHPGSRVTFLREPDNAFDKRAVMAIDESGRKLGYIPKNQNAIISALLDAGKSFYGIVPENPFPGYEDQADSGTEVPTILFVELYMREFTGPEDMNRIPRQGEQGSYAVISVQLTEEEPVQIRSIYAIKVINGEERGAFHEWADDGPSRESEEKLIRDFDRFAGYLPLVGHMIEGKTEECLAEAYGIFLGKAFSNRTIDTAAMVMEHLPDLADASVDEINKVLDLAGAGYTGEEAECRMTWALYRRLERSELERRMSTAQVRMLPLDRLLNEGRLSEGTYQALYQAGLLLLGDVMDRSERDLRDISRMTPKNVDEIRRLLHTFGEALSEEDFKAGSVTMNFPEQLQELEAKVHGIVVGLMTDEEQREMPSLPKEEQLRRINRTVEKKLELCRLLRNRSTYESVLFLGAFCGYRGDYSQAGFAYVEGLAGEDVNMSNGYLVLGRFYADWKAGRLRPEAEQSMMKACIYLAEGLIEKKFLMDDLALEDRLGAASVLYSQAVSYAGAAPKTEETAELLLAVGQIFFYGEYETTEGETIEMEQDPELAYKAFYYAAKLGDSYAKELMERVPGTRKTGGESDGFPDDVFFGNKDRR